MNGYVKMKRLRRMKITKIISAVTAVSMTVTGLAVAASANSASPDFISEALGELSNYGIVAGDMVTSSHFESNFAVQNLQLNNNFDVSRFVGGKNRTVTCSVTSDGDFKNGESKKHYLGVYCGGKIIDIEYRGVIQEGIIALEFREAGTQTFTFTIPSEYKYETVYVHKLDWVVDEEARVGQFEYADGDTGIALTPFAGDESGLLELNSQCLISDSLVVSNELFGENKTVYVGPDIYEHLNIEQDGRISYRSPAYEWSKEDGDDYWGKKPVLNDKGEQVYSGSSIIANNRNKFILTPNAHDDVQQLIDTINTASNALASVNSESDKVLYHEVHGSIYSDTPEARKIHELYEFIKDNPGYSLLVNVYLEKGENTFRFNSGAVSDTDVDTCSRIVFNFIGGNVNDTHISLADGFRGTAIAPGARVSLASTICGAVYAPQFAVSNGELHMATYRAFNHTYEAYFYNEEETTTTTEEETTTSPEETTTPVEETTTPEDTTTPPEETTSETEETTTPVEESSETSDTPPAESVTTPDTTVPETTPDTTAPETTPDTTVPETTPETTVPETTPETTVPETTPETTPDTTVPETTPETTVPETTPDTTVPETTPETTVPETTPDTTIPETTPETTVPETTPDTTVPETTPDTTAPVTTPEMTAPVTTPDITAPETTSPIVTTGPTDFFETPETTTTTTAVETTPETSEVTTVPPETTTVIITTPPVTTEPVLFEVPETTTATVDVTSDGNTPPPPVTETTELTTTTTVPITFELEEEVPRGVVPPEVPLIEIDEEVPLSDRPMHTGVDSKVGLFAVIGGAALVIGVGAQAYSVFLKKKN